jgi:hypothetical protein
VSQVLKESILNKVDNIAQLFENPESASSV